MLANELRHNIRGQIKAVNCIKDGTMKANAIPAQERLGMSRAEAAEYIGVSMSLFDEMVQDSRMPKPKNINTRKVWHRPSLEKAFANLPEDGQTQVSPGSWRSYAA
jgi:hypothetical protein